MKTRIKVSIKVFLCVLCALCGAQVSYAAEPRILTLDQAIALALDKNRDIEKAREYARLVQGRYVEERSAALPQLTLTGSVAAARDSSQQFAGLPVSTQQSRVVDLSLSQPLYTWGKVSAAIRAAQVGLKTADEQLRLFRQAAYRDVATAFYDILLARELHQLAVQNLEQKRRHQDQAHQKLTAGVATDYDTLAADVAADNARPEVIRSENQIRLARERLRFLLGIDQQDIDVTGNLEVSTTATLEYEALLATARQKRPELLDLRYRIGIYNELVTIAAADNKPRLDLKGGVGWHYLDLADTRQDGAAWSLGVFFSFPFFDGFKTDGRVQQARSDLRTRQIDEAKLLDNIALEVRDANYTLSEAGEIVRSLTGTVTQAQRLLTMAEKGFEYGVKIRLEVEDAQVNLLQAQSNLARAKRDLLVARTNLAWATGALGE